MVKPHCLHCGIITAKILDVSVIQVSQFLVSQTNVLLNPGLGGMRDVTSAIISHEQTQ